MIRCGGPRLGKDMPVRVVLAPPAQAQQAQQAQAPQAQATATTRPRVGPLCPAPATRDRPALPPACDQGRLSGVAAGSGVVPEGFWVVAEGFWVVAEGRGRFLGRAGVLPPGGALPLPCRRTVSALAECCRLPEA